MDWLVASESWWGRLVLERSIAAVYVVAFVCAALQFRALIGTHGMLPVQRYVAKRRFWSSPSIFAIRYSDGFFAAVCWAGVLAAAGLVAGLADLLPLWATVLVWLGLWLAYLSIVNVGQTWYAFGWESLLLETGFLVIFIGNGDVAPSLLVMWLVRWLVFRVEFGAGLIKLRGDRWRDLTCLDYHHETQPMPGPMSWFFHRLRKPLHRVEVAGNHVVQLVVPFGLFAPQPVASTAAAIIVVSQLWLVLSGNFAWLNWVTIVLAASVVDTSTVSSVLGLSPPTEAAAAGLPVWFGVLVVAYTALVVVLSWRPTHNLMSRRQRMNSTFDTFHLVNSYGAFGSVGRTRREVVFEGTNSDTPARADTLWKEYEFKGKPGDVRRMPRQWSPYHLRLDWLMWFAAISPSYAQPWTGRLCEGMLTDDHAITELLRRSPFADEPPTYVRALLYRYRFTTAGELIRHRAWWHRELIGAYLEPVGLREAHHLGATGR